MRTDVDFEYLSPLAYTVESNSREFQEQSDLSYFMKMAGRRKLLNAEEERELGTRLWTSRRRLLRILRASQSENRRAIVLDVLPPKRVVTASTRRRLARVERRAREAALPSRRLSDTLAETVAEMDDIRQTFVESNLRLVVWVAKRFRGRGFDFIDLIQEGSLGLMRAIDRFDPAVGARFSDFRDSLDPARDSSRARRESAHDPYPGEPHIGGARDATRAGQDRREAGAPRAS